MGLLQQGSLSHFVLSLARGTLPPRNDRMWGLARVARGLVFSESGCGEPLGLGTHNEWS